MAADTISRWRWVVRLLVLLVVLAPLVVQFGGATSDVLLAFDATLDAAIDAALVVRALGFAVVLVILVLLIRRKRRSRGRNADDAPEQPAKRETEGTGEVYAPYAYNNQQRARREGERIRERAEEIAAADREARK